ncbi:YobI family P-loop NTPase [Cetobacterium sp.]|uniref:YobI family P-loop NTPase n=1 Tax=Cetobacterium sp. TaxID=2071632 RepID=UPI003EE42B91
MKKGEEMKNNIKFLYLLKDDIFILKDRIKFFDFIIPIIPVMDNSNSYDKILELFDKEYRKELNKYFLQDISLYIDDMRLLKNLN